MISIFVTFSFVMIYGIAIVALGMLSTIATGLTIDVYGSISDNTGGIGEMAGMSYRIRERTDAFNTARNTNSAIGKFKMLCSISHLIISFLVVNKCDDVFNSMVLILLVIVVCSTMSFIWWCTLLVLNFDTLSLNSIPFVLQVLMLL